MKQSIFLTGILVLLTACTSVPPKTLDQKLSEVQSPADRKEVLRLACLNEAEVVNGKAYPFKAPTRGHSVPRTPQEVYKAKSLCRKMDNLSDNQGDDAPQIKAALSSECSLMLKAYAEKYPADVRHVSAMTKICREMIK